jgi:hypothetical protein
MRFRGLWAIAALTAMLGAGLANPLHAQSDDTSQDAPDMETTTTPPPPPPDPTIGTMANPANPYQSGDMLGMIHSITRPEVRELEMAPTFWFDIGANFPMATFQDRQWTNGFSLQVGSRFWSSGGLFNVDGVLGVFLNEDSRFNEGQTQDFYYAGPSLSNGGPVESHKHLLVPFSVELNLEGTNPDFSPFGSIGPSINWSRETTVWQDSTLITQEQFFIDNWPTDDYGYLPHPGALTAHSAKNITKFHPGYAARAGLRFRLANSQARLMATLNTWYERSHPLTTLGAFFSFGL